MGTGDEALEILRTVLATDLPVLVDADGLTVLAQNLDLVRGRSAPTLLTPHAGEFARLAGTGVGDDRLSAVRALAAELGATVLLKAGSPWSPPHRAGVRQRRGVVLGGDGGSG